MSSNSRGSYKTTRENMMKAFDKLPSEVRMALANASLNAVPQPYATMLKRGNTINTVVGMIKLRDGIRRGDTMRALEDGTYCLDIRIIQGKKFIFGPDGIGRPLKKEK